MVARTLAAFCLLTLLLGSTTYAQDEVDAVYLHNGSKILGTIIEMVPNSHVKIRMYDGSEIVYAVDRIEKVRKENLDPDSDGGIAEEEDAIWYTQYDEEESEFLRTAYWELGGTLGTPGGINLTCGYWFGLLGTKVSGGFYENGPGIQGEFGIKLHDDRVHSSAIAVVAGYSYLRPRKEREYYGVVYDLNYRGLFLQVGFGLRPQGLSHPRLIGQIGYVHRFLPD